MYCQTYQAFRQWSLTFQRLWKAKRKDGRHHYKANSCRSQTTNNLTESPSAPMCSGRLSPQDHRCHKSSNSFGGESTTHRDFRPPSHDALVEASQRRACSHDKRPCDKRSRLFDGESTTHRDFRPPSHDAIVEASQRRAQSHGRRCDRISSSRKSESAGHTDCLSPSRDSLKGNIPGACP